MRIFLTGATGYVGRAVLDALVRAGHDVTALVRDNEKARRVAARGAHPVIGNLAEPESFRSSVDAQDGYVHTAYDGSVGTRSGESSSGARDDRARRRSVRVRPRVPAPARRFIIYTSGVWVLGRRPNRPSRTRRSTRLR